MNTESNRGFGVCFFHIHLCYLVLLECMCACVLISVFGFLFYDVWRREVDEINKFVTAFGVVFEKIHPFFGFLTSIVPKKTTNQKKSAEHFWLKSC